MTRAERRKIKQEINDLDKISRLLTIYNEKYHRSLIKFDTIHLVTQISSTWRLLIHRINFLEEMLAYKKKGAK